MTDALASSPLANVSPDALGDLFTADPATLDDSAFSALISELRRRRSAFKSEEATKALRGKSPKAPRTSPPDAASASALDKPTGELELGDLFGEAQ